VREKDLLRKEACNKRRKQLGVGGKERVALEKEKPCELLC